LFQNISNFPKKIKIVLICVLFKVFFEFEERRKEEKGHKNK